MITTRRIFTALVLSGALLAGGLTMPQARATKGQCDPAPDPYNSQTYSKGNGTVTVDVGYGWDGVSVWPACAGPLVGARVTNTGQQTWYAVFQGRRNKRVVITITPGFQRTYSATQLSTVGLDTLDDLAEFTLSTTPAG